jgi:hypothetical protein
VHGQCEPLQKNRDTSGTHTVDIGNKNPPERGLLKRIKGLEPSNFCMANASDRSLPSAPVRSNGPAAGISFERANATEPERTLNLAILATESGAEPGAGGDLGVLAPLRALYRNAVSVGESGRETGWMIWLA